MTILCQCQDLLKSAIVYDFCNKLNEIIAEKEVFLACVSRHTKIIDNKRANVLTTQNEEQIFASSGKSPPLMDRHIEILSKYDPMNLILAFLFCEYLFLKPSFLYDKIVFYFSQGILGSLCLNIH